MYLEALFWNTTQSLEKYLKGLNMLKYRVKKMRGRKSDYRSAHFLIKQGPTKGEVFASIANLQCKQQHHTTIMNSGLCLPKHWEFLGKQSIMHSNQRAVYNHFQNEEKE